MERSSRQSKIIAFQTNFLALNAAVEGAQQVTKMIDDISQASNMQASSIIQVTQGIDQISSVVQTNSATAEETAAASEELSGQSQILKGLINQFELKDVEHYVPAVQTRANTERAVSAPPSTASDKY